MARSYHFAGCLWLALFLRRFRLPRSQAPRVVSTRIPSLPDSAAAAAAARCVSSGALSTSCACTPDVLGLRHQAGWSTQAQRAPDLPPRPMTVLCSRSGAAPRTEPTGQTPTLLSLTDAYLLWLPAAVCWAIAALPTLSGAASLREQPQPCFVWSGFHVFPHSVPVTANAEPEAGAACAAGAYLALRWLLPLYILSWLTAHGSISSASTILGRLGRAVGHAALYTIAIAMCAPTPWPLKSCVSHTPVCCSC